MSKKYIPRLHVNKFLIKLLRNSSMNAYSLKNDVVYIKDLYFVDPIIVYLLVIKGEINRYPNMYFSQHGEIKKEHKYRIRRIVRYLLEDQLRWSKEDIYNNLELKVFTDNFLNPIVNKVFCGSVLKTLEFVYPKKFYLWNFSKLDSPKLYWTEENSIFAIRTTIRKIYKWNRFDICSKLDYDFFKDNNLSVAIKKTGGTIFSAVTKAFPEYNLNPWELRFTTNNYWSKETGTIALKWVLEDVLNFSRTQIVRYYEYNLLGRFHLTGIVSKKFDNSPFKMLNYTYPNEYFEWELVHATNGFWKSKENRLKFIDIMNEHNHYVDKGFFLSLTNVGVSRYIQDNKLYIYEKRKKTRYFLECNDLINKLLEESDSDAYRVEKDKVYILDLYKVSPVIVFLLIDQGKLELYPKEYFKERGKFTRIGVYRYNIILSYYLSTLYKYSIEELYENFTIDNVNKKGISTIFYKVSDKGIIENIIMIYPNLKVWKFKYFRCPTNYWTEEKFKEAIIYSIGNGELQEFKRDTIINIGLITPFRKYCCGSITRLKELIGE